MVNGKMKLDSKNDVNMWKSHNEYDIIKVPPKTISKEIRYDSNQLYHKTQKKQAPNNKRTSTNRNAAETG